MTSASWVGLYLGFFIFVQVTLLLPGYALLKRFQLFARPSDQVIFGYGISMALYGALAIFHFIGLPKLVVGALALLIWIVSALVAWPARGWRKRLSSRTLVPLAALVIISAIGAAYTSLPLHLSGGYIPDPKPVPRSFYSAFNVKILNLAHTPANDNYIPYRQAQFFTDQLSITKNTFIGEWDVNFFYRTPLMGAITSFYYDVLHENLPVPYLWSVSPSAQGHSYELFQIMAAILNSLFIVPAYAFIRKLFSQRTAVVSTLLLSLSPFFLYNNFFSWPKSLVAYFILCSWLLIVRQERPWLAGLFAGLAYLVHDLSFVYLAGSIVYLVLRRAWGYMARFVSVMALLAAPWLALARFRYHQSSLFFYYPFSLTDIPADPSNVISQFFHTPLRVIATIKLRAVYDLLFHLRLRHYFGYQPNGYIWSDLLMTIPGAVGFLLFPFSYYALIRWFRDDKLVITSFVITPLVVLFIMLGRPLALGIGAMHFAEALVVVLTGFGVAFVLKLSRVVSLVVFTGLVASYYFMIGFGYNFDFAGWNTGLAAVTVILSLCAQLATAIVITVVVIDQAGRTRLVRWLNT